MTKSCETHERMMVLCLICVLVLTVLLLDKAQLMEAPRRANTS